MNIFGRNLALWVVIGLLLLALFQMFSTSGNRTGSTTIPYSDFMAAVERGQVGNVTIQGSPRGTQITGHYAEGTSGAGSSFITFAK